MHTTRTFRNRLRRVTNDVEAPRGTGSSCERICEWSRFTHKIVLLLIYGLRIFLWVASSINPNMVKVRRQVPVEGSNGKVTPLTHPKHFTMGVILAK